MANTMEALTAFGQQIQKETEEQVNAAVAAVESRVDERMQSFEKKIERARPLEVKHKGDVRRIEGARHPMLETLIKVTGTKTGDQNISAFLSGPAGSGKTHAATQVADALGVPFYSKSVTAQSTESLLLGYMNAGGDYIPSVFRMAFEGGGLFLLDEMDAGNPNILGVLNSALANGNCAFPDGMIEKSDDFYCIAAGNTVGSGANRQYVGRNQLDMATLDRFALIEWGYDENFEKHLLAQWEKFGERWHKVVLTVRNLIDRHGVRGVASTRAAMRGAALLESGINLDNVITMSLGSTVPPENLKDWRPQMREVFGKGA